MSFQQQQQEMNFAGPGASAGQKPNPFNEGLLREQQQLKQLQIQVNNQKPLPSPKGTPKLNSPALKFSPKFFEQDSYFPDNEPLFGQFPVSSGFVPPPQEAMGEMVAMPMEQFEAYHQQQYYPDESHAGQHVVQQPQYYQAQEGYMLPPAEGQYFEHENYQQQQPQYYANEQQMMVYPPEQAYLEQQAVIPPSQAQQKEQRAKSPVKERSMRNHIPFIDSLEDDQRGDRKCMYLCIPVNRRHRFICLGITGFFLVLIIVITAVFYPRLPNMQVLSINPVGNNSYQLTNFDKSNPNKFKFTMNMVMVVSVINTNMYHLKVDGIDLTTYVNANGTTINNANPSPATALFGIQSERVYVSNENYKNQIGTGSYGSITFPPNVNVTFTMNLNINYSPGPLGALNDPTLNEMIQLCVEGDPNVDTGRRTTISYIAVNSVGLLKYIGYNPTMQNQVKIRCPFQGAARTAFINAITGKGNGNNN